MGWLALVIGSIAGGAARYGLGTAISRWHESPFPYGTLTINALACVVIGFLSSAGGVKFPMTFETRLLLITGFCGGFSTFSSFVMEAVALARGGAMTMAAGYVGASLVLGFLAFFVGAVLGRALPTF
jgi:CrcB protein